MTNSKYPYSFPLKSRAAMTDYICNDRTSYSDGGDTNPLSWNVKAHGVNWEHPGGEYKCDSAFDKAWSEYVSGEGADTVCNWAFEDAQEYYRNDWTSYPGDDQGDWTFAFYGRQAGHLCLTHWRGNRIERMSFDDLREFCDGLSFADLKKFYVGIVCADSDFTATKASENVEYQVNHIREQWEDERKAEREEEAAAKAEADKKQARSEALEELLSVAKAAIEHIEKGTWHYDQGTPAFVALREAIKSVESKG